MSNAFIRAAQGMVSRYYVSSSDASYDWAGREVAAVEPRRLLDVGCGDGSRLFAYLRTKPDIFCGVEGNPVLAPRARDRGIDVASFDLNGRWPYADKAFDAIHSSQVIEHIHHTRLFLSEAYRVLAPGGVAVLTSENLSSLLNLLALTLGYAPFSLQPVCGWYIGNPFGLHANTDIPIESEGLDLADPAYSGIMGHIRVLGVRQARELIEKIGFRNSEVRSIGLMPLPGWMGRPLERIARGRGHWLLIRAVK